MTILPSLYNHRSTLCIHEINYFFCRFHLCLLMAIINLTGFKKCLEYQQHIGYTSLWESLEITDRWPSKLRGRPTDVGASSVIRLTVWMEWTIWPVFRKLHAAWAGIYFATATTYSFKLQLLQQFCRGFQDFSLELELHPCYFLFCRFQLLGLNTCWVL